MDKETELLKKRFIELARKAESYGRYFFTGFLNIAEQNLLHVTMKENHYTEYKVSGGHEGAERVIAGFGIEDLTDSEDIYPITCLEINPVNIKFADELSHRDYLGALMNLGIERAKLGDIIVRKNLTYIFCVESIAEYIIENLDKIKHTNVKCHITDGTAQELKAEYEEVSVSVSSERLDAILAKLYNLSRSDANSLFNSEKVYVNSVIIGNNSYVPHQEDIISVRGYGKFIYDGIGGINRKGKKCVKIRKMV